MPVSDSNCINDSDVVAATKSKRRDSIEKFIDSDPSTSTPIPISLPSEPRPRSTFKSIVLVLTVTFATIFNVGLSRCSGLMPLFFEKKKLIIIGCKLFNIFNSPTRYSERVGLGRSTSPVDRIGLLFEFGV